MAGRRGSAAVSPHCSVSVTTVADDSGSSPVAPRRRLLWVLIAALAACATGARAESSGTAAAGGCKLATMGTAVVNSVVDGRTITLDDGRTVRLAGIEADPTEAASEAARRGLAELVLGRTIELRNTGAGTDRYGRSVAHVFALADVAQPDLAPRWVQAELVARGHARVAGRVAGDRPCASELFARERAARDGRLGLWADPYYVILSADDAATIAAARGRFAIVEGKVLSVRESGATIYVNFGRRWTEDFTVTILKRNERSFAAAGLDPKRLEGQRIRIRGVIEERGGPWIEAARPEQIELGERR
jgi:endonuclease YncB( thermonuclease family)